jgi:hypothetical protein
MIEVQDLPVIVGSTGYVQDYVGNLWLLIPKLGILYGRFAKKIKSGVILALHKETGTKL